MGWDENLISFAIAPFPFVNLIKSIESNITDDVVAKHNAYSTLSSNVPVK